MAGELAEQRVDLTELRGVLAIESEHRGARMEDCDALRAELGRIKEDVEDRIGAVGELAGLAWEGVQKLGAPIAGVEEVASLHTDFLSLAAVLAEQRGELAEFRGLLAGRIGAFARQCDGSKEEVATAQSFAPPLKEIEVPGQPGMRMSK